MNIVWSMNLGSNDEFELWKKQSQKCITCSFLFKINFKNLQNFDSMVSITPVCWTTWLQWHRGVWLFFFTYKYRSNFKKKYHCYFWRSVHFFLQCEEKKKTRAHCPALEACLTWTFSGMSSHLAGGTEEGRSISSLANNDLQST